MTVTEMIVAGPESPLDAVRHVHVIAFEYTGWNRTTERYDCRGVWRNANLANPVAQTKAVYTTETEAVAAAAQAFLDTTKQLGVLEYSVGCDELLTEDEWLTEHGREVVTEAPTLPGGAFTATPVPASTTRPVPASVKPGYYWVETSAGVEIGLWDATSWRFCAGESREQFNHAGIKVWSRVTPPLAALATRQIERSRPAE
jgi:hypothetical protein